MSRELLGIEQGILIFKENGNSGISIIRGINYPGLEQLDIGANVGSLYLRENGESYKKKIAGSGEDKWKKLIDIDAQNLAIKPFEDAMADSAEPTGFIRDRSDSMGIIELSPDGVIIHRIDQNSIHSTSDSDHVNYDPSIVPGEFIDGVLASPRTMSITPVAENELEVYISGEKSLILASQQVTLSDDPGIHFVYFNLSGILKESLIFDYKYFRSQPIVSLVYGNPTTQKLVDFADERHGITMDGFTHMYLHLTEGARYYNGMDIPGLVNGGLTHGVIGEGNLYDEDILQNCPPQADLPFIYLLGAGWDIKKDSNLLGYTVLNDTYISYNESVGGIHQLTEMTSPQDCTIMYIVATNNAVYPYMKLVGQYKYANASAARDAIADELAEISTYGLPSPEFVFVGAIILGRDGDLKILEDGSTFLDLREAKIRGASGGQSQEIVDHRSTTNRTAPDQHPTSAITGLDALLAGPILTAPDATRYKIVVSNDGTLSTVEV